MPPLPPPFTISADGAALRGVTCENCDCQYVYRLSRRVSQHGHGIPDPSAASVKKRLTRELRRAVDPVPCPDCGYLQRHMVRAVKMEKLAMLILIAIPTALVCGVLVVLGFMDDLGLVSLSFACGFAALSLAALATAAFFIVLRDHNTRERMAHRLKEPANRTLRREDFPGKFPDDLFGNAQVGKRTL